MVPLIKNSSLKKIMDEHKEDKVDMKKHKQKPIHSANISQNWKKIQKKALVKASTPVKKHKKQIDTRPLSQQIFDPPASAYSGYSVKNCEMVETVEGDAIARASIVNYNGKVVYDKFVKPDKRIIDFRSHVSGVTPEVLKTAITFAQCRQEGRTLVGHSLKGDLKLLNYEHPKHLIRDVSKYKKYKDKIGGKQSLRVLTDTFLQRVIQEGAHSSVEDAQAALGLYREAEKDWENMIKQKKRAQKRTIGDMFPSFKSVKSDKPAKISKVEEEVNDNKN